MKRLKVIFALLGGIVFVALAAFLVVGAASWIVKPGVPGQTILEADLETSFQEAVPEDPLARIMTAGQPALRDFVWALERAEGDKRVTGLVARIGGGGWGMAQTQEIRDAVLAFRKAGKRAVAFAETFGEAGAGNQGFYLATAFDEIVLQPSGDVGLTGILMESVFLRGTLDKLGVVPRMDQRHEYKNAMNTFTETTFTPPHREAMQAILDSWFNQMVRGIAQGRKLSEAEVRALIDRGPFLGAEALKARLVDRLGYRDEVFQQVREAAGSKSRLLYWDKYLERAGRPHEKGEKIALIYGVGGVARGENGFDPLMGEFTMGSDTVAGAFRQAAADDDVRAILFRVDSPGGSYVASDAIWRETVKAREKGKPVIVSMGNLAGSGGYFVAMQADKIVAQPGTITGSIGVLGGKMLTRGLYDKLGISFDAVQGGAHATQYSGHHDYSPEEWSRHTAWLDRVYEDFTTKVAQGRKLPLETVQRIARGRIWSGEEARRLGLVDELGGFPVALRLAKEAAKIPAGEAVQLAVFPPPRGWLAALQEKRQDNSDPATRALGETLRLLQPAVRFSRTAGLLDPPAGELRLPAWCSENTGPGRRGGN